MIAARRQVIFYFVAAFAISWLGAAAVIAPKLIHQQAIGKFDGLMMFPVMLLGPAIAGIALTVLFDGRQGLRALGQRLVRVRFPLPWYFALVIPFAMIWAVLSLLHTIVSPAFVPNFFWPGAAFGLIAGLLEEIGWTGFALPRMIGGGNAVAPSIVLGLIWGIWHLPVLDFLGAATPHGAAWAPFCLAFIIAMAAMRVIIAWLYVNTQSVLLAQAMHACSTAALVVLSPQVAPAQEALWYTVYGGALWLLVFLVTAVFGRRLKRTP